MIAVSADTREDSAAYIAEENVTVPLLADPTLDTINAYGTAMEGKDIAVPSTFVIDQKKIIRWKYIGEDMTDRPSEEALLQMAAGLVR